MDTIDERLSHLSSKSLEIFSKEFIESYTKNAFGSFSARETEILIFMLFQKIGLLQQEDSLYKISRLLKISPTKVKNLLLQSKLRDPSFDERRVVTSLIASIKQAILDQENKNILLSIEDPLVREDVIDKFKGLGHLPDFSRNKEILKVSVDAFAALADRLLDEEEKAEIIAKLKNNKDVKEFVSSTFKDTLIHIISTFAVKGLSFLYKAFTR